MTWCPRDCNPTAASITKRSAPPIPKSGCTKTILRGVVVFVAISAKQLPPNVNLNGGPVYDWSCDIRYLLRTRVCKIEFYRRLGVDFRPFRVT